MAHEAAEFGDAVDIQSTWGRTIQHVTEPNLLIDTYLDLDNGWRPHDARDDQAPNEDLESLRITANP